MNRNNSDLTTPVSAKSKGRSLVSNGSRPFLPDSASALQMGRRYRDVMAALTSDLGGFETLGEAQLQLVRRAATISLQCEAWDAAAAAGEGVDWDLYGRTTNTLRRTFEALGRRESPSPSTAARIASGNIGIANERQASEATTMLSELYDAFEDPALFGEHFETATWDPLESPRSGLEPASASPGPESAV